VPRATIPHRAVQARSPSPLLGSRRHGFKQLFGLTKNGIRRAPCAHVRAINPRTCQAARRRPSSPPLWICGPCACGAPCPQPPQRNKLFFTQHGNQDTRTWFNHPSDRTMEQSKNNAFCFCDSINCKEVIYRSALNSPTLRADDGRKRLLC
jgi:hypothetical protein